VGADHIPYVCIATAVNMAGGQPISLGNLRAVRELCQRHGIRVIHDATRVAENAYFIKEREPGCADMSVAEIVRAICDLTDGCTMSAKKDALVNIGGFLALNEDDVFDACRSLVVVYEACTPTAAWPVATWRRRHRSARERSVRHIKARVVR